MTEIGGNFSIGANQSGNIGNVSGDQSHMSQDWSYRLMARPPDALVLVPQLTALQDILDRPPLLRKFPLAADLNRVYQHVAEQVVAVLRGGGFSDPQFASLITVEVAARYLDVLSAWIGVGVALPPRCWTPLLQARSARLDSRRAAAVGVAANVNFDLPFALVATFEHLNVDPVDDTGQHADYRRLIKAFGASLPSRYKVSLPRGQVLVETALGKLDEDSHEERLDDYARDVAWRNAQRVWQIRDDLAERDGFRVRLDNATATVTTLLASRFADNYF
jgi:hypothetical protein